MIRKKTLSEFFNISPTPSLLLHIDWPKFTIANVNEAYLEATQTKREDLIGKGIFEAFPDNDSDPSADGVKNLSHSLHTVVKTNQRHKMAIQKYDIPIRGTSKFELKYWEPENIPLFSDTSELQYIIHCVRDVTEKVKTEKQLNEFEYFFNNTNDFSCIANTEGYFETVNLSFNNAFGYSQNELEKEPFIDFVHPDDVAGTLKACDKLKSGTTIIHFINRYRKKDGSYLFLDWSATPNPVTGKLYCIARDITESKKAEEVLKLLNEELEQRVKERTDEVVRALKENCIILESIGDAFFAVDANWTITYWNRIAERDLSVLKKDIIGKNLWEVFSTSINSISYKKCHEAVSTNQVIHFENYYTVSKKWYEISAYPLEKGLSVYFKDITDRKKAEELIEKNNERFEYVTKATFDAIWDWDLAVDQIYWGNGFEKIFGYNLKELKNNSSAWRENIHPDDLERITQSYYNTIKSNESNWIEEYRYKKSNGQYCYVINKGIVIRDATGRATRIIGAMQDITKKKEEELRLKLLESVVTNANDAVVIKEARPTDGIGRKIVYVNESFSRMTGYSSGEIIGKTHQLLQGPHTDKEELARFYKALDDFQPCEITIINYNKNGQEYWVNLSLNPVTNAKGEYTHWISIERDVTEKKLAEAESLKQLKEISEYKYAINESSIVAITNHKGIITHVNDNFCKVSKYSREELLGQDHRIVNSNYHPKEFIKHLWTTIANGRVWKGEIKNKAKDGSHYWVDTTIVPFLNENGKPYQYLAIRFDITERKNQDQRLKNITTTLSNTLESIQDGFYTLDSDWNIGYWNKEAEKLSGKKQKEMIGKNFWEIYEGHISNKITKTFHKAKTDNNPIQIELYSKQDKNWFEINAFPSEIGLTVYFKKITERKTIESKLKKSNRDLEKHVKELAVSNEELEQFAYIASHDLQEPLRMVTSFLSQIERKYENVLDEKGKKYIFFAVDGAKRMRQIILDLLEFSRIGKNEDKVKEVDLTEVVEEIILLYSKQIEDKEAVIKYTELPKILTHTSPIKQVFQNLISNALKYSKPDMNPVITISCQENNKEWIFEIKDNGIGISSEYYDKIFIIFQRLHGKDEFSGTGMGLAIAKKIIENLRGQIWLKSEEGKGTTFYFTIPKTKQKKL